MRAINFKFENSVISMVEHNGRYIVENEFGGVAVYAESTRKQITIVTNVTNSKEFTDAVVLAIVKDRYSMLEKVKQFITTTYIESRPKVVLKTVDLIDYIIDFGIEKFECKIGAN